MRSKCPINQLFLILELTLDFPGLNPNSLLWSRLRLLWALSEASFRPGSISCPRCEIQLLESFDLQFFTNEGSAFAGLAFAAGPDLTLEPWDLGRGLQARTGWHVEDPFPGVPGVGASVQDQHAPDSLFPLTADVCSWHLFQAESHFAIDFLLVPPPPPPASLGEALNLAHHQDSPFQTAVCILRGARNLCAAFCLACVERKTVVAMTYRESPPQVESCQACPSTLLCPVSMPLHQP